EVEGAVDASEDLRGPLGGRGPNDPHPDAQGEAEQQPHRPQDESERRQKSLAEYHRASPGQVNRPRDTRRSGETALPSPALAAALSSSKRKAHGVWALSSAPFAAAARNSS